MPWMSAAFFCLIVISLLSNHDAYAGDRTLQGPSGRKGILLFNSVEFKGPLKALTKWNRILSEAEKQVVELNTCDPSSGRCPPGAMSWKTLLAKAEGMTGLNQLKYVSRYINRWPYRLDIDVYGVSDYWATPQEFLKLSGDCEDYCITKYFVLKELGYDAGRLRIVIIRDRIRNLTHAALAVYLDQTVYIMDNLTDAVFDQAKYKHYIPQYSFNETNRWAHISLRRPFPGRNKKW